MPTADPSHSIVAHFSTVQDPRVLGRTAHSLPDILVVTICAVICGADSWVQVEEFGRAKEEWFRSFLKLAGGIPSHDTFGRVFSLLDPEELSACFASWVAALSAAVPQMVAIDGKTLRGSFDTASGKSAVHMVSAWATQSGLVLGQVKTDEKSNEITAIPKLLELLHLKGCIVTIDAMGCQKKIAAKVVERQGDYLLSLKENHPIVHAEVAALFNSMPLARIARGEETPGISCSFYRTVDGGHGRIETRRCWVTDHIDWFEDKHLWKGLKCFVLIECKREVGDKVSIERHYFLSSIATCDARQALQAKRSHWATENNLHCALHMHFREDESRVRTGNAAENFAVIRHIALNLLKQEKTTKVGIKTKRLKAGWDHPYLLRILTGG